MAGRTWFKTSTAPNLSLEMAFFDKSNIDSPPHSPKSLSSDTGYPFWRKPSTSSSPSSSQVTSPITPGAAPKVQLVPYARTASFERSFSDAERELLDKASFDALDLSSQDFDFADIFTYDKPQKPLNRVVEVSRPTRSHRDWSNFSFSHYPAAMNARNKVNNRTKNGIGEMYVKNHSDARKH
jgi:hypothetical protein